MSVQIVTRHMRPSASFRQGVTELCEAVTRCCPDVLSIRVVLDGINDPDKPGLDKSCHLMVRGRDHLSIDISEFQDDVWQSVDAAFRRLSNKLARRRKQGGVEKLRGSSGRMRVRDYVFLDQGLYAGMQTQLRLYNAEGKCDE